MMAISYEACLQASSVYLGISMRWDMQEGKGWRGAKIPYYITTTIAFDIWAFAGVPFVVEQASEFCSLQFTYSFSLAPFYL